MDEMNLAIAIGIGSGIIVGVFVRAFVVRNLDAVRKRVEATTASRATVTASAKAVSGAPPAPHFTAAQAHKSVGLATPAGN